MKKITLFCIVCIMPFVVCRAQQHYYWADGKKNAIEPDSTIVVLMNGHAEAGKSITALQADKVERYDDCAIFRNTTKQHRKELKDKKIEFATAYRVNNVPLIVTNVISLRPKNGVGEIDRAFTRSMRFRDKTASGVYHYIAHNFRETLSVANAIAESGLVEWCQPDFVVEFKSTTLDPLFNQQYYLNNTGQTGGTSNVDIDAPEAWAISKGCDPVRVAVLDFGVEPHEDLGSRYLTGFTALNPSGTGLPASSQFHGQACAGIIAASHDNNLGIAGVAPTSRIIPVNGFLGINNVSKAADAIDAGWRPTRGNADVLSNSWNWASAPSLAEISQAINDARTQGRAGKGAIVVFSAGNGGGAIEFPANVEGVITVGAINKSGSLWGYSARGPELDLVAPSGNGNSTGDVVTMDLMNGSGANSTNYLSNFGGTSAAAPQVAGIAALMLSVNPNLTEAQVRTMLQQSATDMGSSGIDNNFGHGRANAQKALSAAFGNITGPSIICSGGQYTLVNQPPGFSVSWSTNNPSGLSINSGGLATRQNNFNGVVTITATVAGPCGNASIQRQIAVGTGVPDLIINPLVYCDGRSLIYNGYTGVIPGATNYHWLVKAGNSSFVSTGFNSPTALQVVWPVSRNQPNTFRLVVSTPCGTLTADDGEYLNTPGTCDEGSRQMQLVVFPNPSKSSFQVQVKDPSDSLNVEVPIHISVFDQFFHEVIDDVVGNGGSLVSTENWRPGNYFIVVRYKDAVLRKQIVVEKK